MSQRMPAMRLSAARAGLAARGGQARDVGLRLVQPVRSRASRAPFVIVLLALVAAGLAGLLLLSTAMQSQAFAIARLQEQQNTLAMRKQALRQEVAQLSSPQRIAADAAKQGMVPASSPVFLRLSDGAVLGSPEAAAK